MPRLHKPLGLRLTEQDILEQLPSLGDWAEPMQQPLPGPGARLIEPKGKRVRRP